MNEHTSLVELIETLKNSLADVDINTVVTQAELEADEAGVLEYVHFSHEKMLTDFLGQRAAKVAAWRKHEKPSPSIENATVYTGMARVGLLSPETVQTLIALLTMMHHCQQCGEHVVAVQRGGA